LSDPQSTIGTEVTATDVCVCVCVCVRERERENACVCVHACVVKGRDGELIHTYTVHLLTALPKYKYCGEICIIYTLTLITYISGPNCLSHAVMWLYVKLGTLVLRPRIASSALLQSASQKLEAIEAPFVRTLKRMVRRLKEKVHAFK